MKKVIFDKALLSDVYQICLGHDSFCAMLHCSLVKLHENAALYACVRSAEGIPCTVYVANDREIIDRNRNTDAEKEWVEAIVDQGNINVFFCYKNGSRDTERAQVFSGVHTPMISVSLCNTMSRLSTENNRIFMIQHQKEYGETEKAAFQKRSAVDLDTIDSSGVDIIYFDGADKLIEKLLYGGCRKLTVFVTEIDRAKTILKKLNELSCKAPFSNCIMVVVEETYAPKTENGILVGNVINVPSQINPQIFFAVNYVKGEGVSVWIGQNTPMLVSDPIYRRLKPHTIHYITSIMSELVLKAVSSKGCRAKRLFKVNAKTLTTETIFKED